MFKITPIPIYFYIFILIITSPFSILAGEKDVYETIKISYNNRNYYNTVTESMRYEFLYPDGIFLNDVILIKSRSYFFGGNYSKAIYTLKPLLSSEDNYYNAQASSYLIYMQIIDGSPQSASLNINLYLNKYENDYPDITEKIILEKASAYAIQLKFDEAEKAIQKYKELYPNGAYINDVNELENWILIEKNRKTKDFKTALRWSFILPGFSWFYTGDYTTGFISLASNLVLSGLTAYNIYNNNYFESAVFAYLSFTFYQYSLTACAENVNNYNNRSDFKKRIKMSVKARF